MDEIEMFRQLMSKYFSMSNGVFQTLIKFYTIQQISTIKSSWCVFVYWIWMNIDRSYNQW